MKKLEVSLFNNMMIDDLSSSTDYQATHLCHNRKWLTWFWCPTKKTFSYIPFLSCFYSPTKKTFSYIPFLSCFYSQSLDNDSKQQHKDILGSKLDNMWTLGHYSWVISSDTFLYCLHFSTPNRSNWTGEGPLIHLSLK